MSKPKNSKKLTISDVVNIKVLLREGVSDSKIADMFFVDRKTINNIKNEKTWKEVEIDSSGKYIEPVKAEEVKPVKKPKSIMSDKLLDEYIVPRFEPVEVIETVQPVELTVDEIEILRQKRIFLDRLWQLKVTRKAYKGKRYNSTRIISTNDWFNKKLHNMWSKDFQTWGFIPLEEFMAQTAWIVQDCVIKMNIVNGDFTWEKVNEDDESSLKILFDCINKALHTGMLHFDAFMQNKQIVDRKKKIDGKNYKFYEHVGIDNESTEQTVIGADGMQTRLIHLLDNDSNFFGGSGEDGRLAHFLNFFEENKRYFLTQQQYERWETICATEHTPDGYTTNDRNVVYGIDKDKTFGTKRTVKKRATQAYKEVYPEFVLKDEDKAIPRLQQHKELELQLWTQFIEIIEDDEIDPNEMNGILSVFILKRLNNQFVLELIYDNLTGFDLMNVHDGMKTEKIKSETLYKIVELVEKRIIKLKKFNATVVPFERNTNEAPSGYAKEEKTPKKHTSLRLMTSGSTFEIVGEE